ncbi:MAG: DUF1566 domain-containing protein, partial [Chloroflexota bacterium]
MAKEFRLLITLTFLISLTFSFSACSQTADFITSSPPITSPMLSYTIVDTGQTKFYDNSKEIPAPKQTESFYGQDAHYQGNQPAYTDNGDGTVTDLNTGLVWQKSPDRNGDGKIEYSDKVTYSEAQLVPAKLNAMKYGGFSDWRLPTVKELYSLIDFRGAEPNPQASSSAGATPYINTDYFEFWGGPHYLDRIEAKLREDPAFLRGPVIGTSCLTDSTRPPSVSS